MEQLKSMKEQLTAQVQGQMCNLSKVDAKEMGEAVDMIKDLAEAIYYCTITEAMEKQDKEPKQPMMYFTERMYPDYYRDMDREYGKMYYTGGGNMGGGRSSSGSSYYTEPYGRMMPSQPMHDPREGRSYNSRRMYMESKEMHHGKEKQMQELEKYMQELSQDITEMIQDASPDEKVMLQQKIATLAQKIK